MRRGAVLGPVAARPLQAVAARRPLHTTRPTLAATAKVEDFTEKAAAYWTTQRIHWLTNGKPHLFAFSPDKPGVPTLLRTMGLLDANGAMAEGGLKKYQQVNTLFAAIEAALAPPLRQDTKRPLRLLDLCAGQGHIALLLDLPRHQTSLCEQMLPAERASEQEADGVLGPQVTDV